MSQHELMPAITLMERKLDEAERIVSGLLSTVNTLRAEAGLPPRDGGSGGGGGVRQSSGNDGVSTQIKPDTFFGQKQQTAIRNYLTMRKAQGLGPAKPREIYDALLAGGFQYEAKDAEIALVGMRALLRKRNEVFVRLSSNGTYGLAAWYPDMKKPKPAPATSADADADTVDDEDDVIEVDTNGTATAKKAAAAS